MARRPRPTYQEMLASSLARPEGLNTLLVDINLQIGALNASVQHLLKMQDEATESRRGMHSKIDDVAKKCSELKTTVERIGPLVDALEDERQQRIGVRRFITKGRLIGATVFASLAWVMHQWHGVKDWLLKMLSRLG